MQTSLSRAAILCGFLCPALVLPVLAQDKPDSPEKPKVTTAKPDDSKPAEPQPKPKEEPDPFVVPDGTPEELFKYIEKIQKRRPERIRSRKEFVEFLKGQQAILAASEKILAAKPTSEQFTMAAHLKLGCLEILAKMNAPGLEKRLADFA